MSCAGSAARAKRASESAPNSGHDRIEQNRDDYARDAEYATM